MLFEFIMEVEDQRDWQRHNNCGKNPFSCFFCHLLSLFRIRYVLDLTYGIGSFYEKCREINVVGVDVHRWDWIVAPKRFIQADALEFIRNFNERVDAVVIDPPYSTRPSSRVENNPERSHLYFGNFPFAKIIQVIKLSRTKASYVILKYMPSNNDEYAELYRLGPRHVITWRFVVNHIVYNDNNKVIRNSTKIFIF